MADGEAAAGAAIHSASAAAATAGIELLDVVFKWIIPLIALVVGFMVGSGIGLSGVLADLLDNVLPTQIPSQAIAIIADLVAIAIWGGVGVSLWHVAHSSKAHGKWGEYILRPVAMIFIGFALSEIPPIFKQAVNTGKLSGLTQQAAAAASSG